MGARLMRRWFTDLCQLKIGAITMLVICGVALGTFIAAVTHTPAADSKPALSSFGQAQALCQTAEQPAAGAAPRVDDESTQEDPSKTTTPQQDYSNGRYISQVPPPLPPHAYNVLVPDWGGTSYRLKTIVNQ